MTTYLLLELTDDGGVAAFDLVEPFSIEEHRQVAPVRTGDDCCGRSATYEVDGHVVHVTPKWNRNG